jgi:hypothetical protein
MKHTNLAVALPLTVGMETGSRSRAIRQSTDCGPTHRRIRWRQEMRRRANVKRNGAGAI